jgi:hypothetical protein
MNGHPAGSIRIEVKRYRGAVARHDRSVSGR